MGYILASWSSGIEEQALMEISWAEKTEAIRKQLDLSVVMPRFLRKPNSFEAFASKARILVGMN